MGNLERKKEVLTPKTDSSGTRTIKRETVEVEKMEIEVDPTKLAEKRKSRLRLIIVFGIIDLILLGLVVYQVVSIFLQIGNNIPQ